MPTQDTTGTSASLSSNVMNVRKTLLIFTRLLVLTSSFMRCDHQPGFNITVPRPFPYLHDSIRRTLGEVSVSLVPAWMH